MTRGPRSSIGPAPLELPVPEGEAAAHVARVEAMLREAIESAGGWLDFARYMALALYAPGLGYYSAGAAKFGAAGDFVTAPELSPLFAPVLAAAFPPLFAAAGARAVLELGPGTGRFAGEALHALGAQGAAPDEYLLLEVGADLRGRQPAQVRELAGPLAGRARWLDTLPAQFSGVVFGNEVLDALPCECFAIREGEPWRLGVELRPPGSAVGSHADGHSAGREPAFRWRARRPDGSQPGDDEFRATLGERLPAALRAALPDGYVGEFQPAIGPWIAALGAMLGRGALLLADYGLPRAHLYHPQRAAGSLRAHYRHRAHDDPFVHPGLTDLSVWVDFTAVAEAADAAGLEVCGFATQAAVLLGGGIEARLAAAMDGADEPTRVRLARGARQLLLPGEMGESVKLMLLGRGFDAAAVPAGFRLQDLRGSL